MTPKEKAGELIEKFQSIIYEHGAGHESTVSFNEIKKLACMLCDEMLNIEFDQGSFKALGHIDCWQGIKHEIEKL